MLEILELKDKSGHRGHIARDTQNLYSDGDATLRFQVAFDFFPSSFPLS